MISRNTETGELRFVWQLNWDDMVRDIDGVILFGGPTKSPHFSERLTALFEGQMRILDATEPFPTLTGITDLETVGISMGACYGYAESYSPLYVNRLPVRVTLENLDSGDSVEYEPFESMTRTFRPFDDFVSGSELPAQQASGQSSTNGQTIRLSIALPNGDEVGCCHFVDKHIDPRAFGYPLRLVIDRLGRVGVQQAFTETVGNSVGLRRFMIIPDTPWQTGRQHEALRRLFEQHRRYEERQCERTSLYVNSPPWEYPTS